MAGLRSAHTAHADIDVRVDGGAGCSHNTIQAATNGPLPANGIANSLIVRNQACKREEAGHPVFRFPSPLRLIVHVVTKSTNDRMRIGFSTATLGVKPMAGI